MNSIVKPNDRCFQRITRCFFLEGSAEFFLYFHTQHKRLQKIVNTTNLQDVVASSCLLIVNLSMRKPYVTDETYYRNKRVLRHSE